MFTTVKQGLPETSQTTFMGVKHSVTGHFLYGQSTGTTHVDSDRMGMEGSDPHAQVSKPNKQILPTPRRKATQEEQGNSYVH